MTNSPLPNPPPKQFRLPKVGQIVEISGRLYRIGEAIGRGAFGEVFECSDEWRNNLVAKILLPLNRGYDEVQSQWLDELSKLVQLRHPNITYVYDAFEYNDTFYLVMERCSSTLNDLVRMPGFNGSIWLPHVAGDILQAVEFIHANGYVHKDLHLDNVFISQVRDKMVPNKPPVYQYKVGDLGISRLESDIDIFNTVLARWMQPPEFLNPAEFGAIGRSVDIYHVGLLLLRMIAGQELNFTPDEILAGVPRATAERLSSPYSNAISRALRRHVSERTTTALELWREIVQATPHID